MKLLLKHMQKSEVSYIFGVFGFFSFLFLLFKPICCSFLLLLRAGEGAHLGQGVSEKGEGVGRKGIAFSQSQTFYRTLSAHEQEEIVQFDWLLACQSKYDIRNLSFVHNSTSGTQQDQNRYAGPSLKKCSDR